MIKLKQIITHLTLATVVFTSACSVKKANLPKDNLYHTDFSVGKDGWQAGFADYTFENKEIFELQESIEQLPSPLDESKKAYMISGMNRSDDLFMYLKKEFKNLKANTSYKITLNLSMASDAMSGGFGVGGAPGESIGLGLGATTLEPKAVKQDNYYRMNINKINQCCTDGQDMIVIGNVANGKQEYTFNMIERYGEFSAKTDASGKLWVIIGTDSGYEGKTTLYYSDIKIEFSEVI